MSLLLLYDVNSTESAPEVANQMPGGTRATPLALPLLIMDKCTSWESFQTMHSRAKENQL